MRGNENFTQDFPYRERKAQDINFAHDAWAVMGGGKRGGKAHGIRSLLTCFYIRKARA